MTKQEFLKLFELEEIYNKYKEKKYFVLGLHDNLTGTKNAVFFIFEENNTLKVSIESFEFSENLQEIEFNLILNEQNIKLNTNELFKNDIFPFLTFDTNFEESLKFIANFINKILIPKYQLMGKVSTY